MGALWLIFYLIGGSSNPRDEDFRPVAAKVCILGVFSLLLFVSSILWVVHESLVIIGGLGFLGWIWVVAGLTGGWNELAADLLPEIGPKGYIIAWLTAIGFVIISGANFYFQWDLLKGYFSKNMAAAAIIAI